MKLVRKTRQVESDEQRPEDAKQAKVKDVLAVVSAAPPASVREDKEVAAAQLPAEEEELLSDPAEVGNPPEMAPKKLKARQLLASGGLSQRPVDLSSAVASEGAPMEPLPIPQPQTPPPKKKMVRRSLMA